MKAFLYFGVIMFLTACQLAAIDVPASETGTQTDVQLIVKFTDPDLSSDQVVMQLNRIKPDRSYRFIYVRPMSGDAHVVIVKGVEEADVEKLLTRLRSNSLVEYVEIDRMMHHQNSENGPMMEGHF